MRDTTTMMLLTVRMRRSPFSARSHAASAQEHIVYNNMLIATGFAGSEEDYRSLKSPVQLWDVGCERQIEIRGPDAARLVQMFTPCDTSKMADDQCFLYSNRGPGRKYDQRPGFVAPRRGSLLGLDRRQRPDPVFQRPGDRTGAECYDP